MMRFLKNAPVLIFDGSKIVDHFILKDDFVTHKGTIVFDGRKVVEDVTIKAEHKMIWELLRTWLKSEWEKGKEKSQELEQILWALDIHSFVVKFDAEKTFPTQTKYKGSFGIIPIDFTEIID